MRRAPVAVEIELVGFGPPTPGEWCPDCNLPSAVRQAWRGVHGMRVLLEGELIVCADCGRWWAA